MTRLTVEHVSDPGARLRRLERGLLEVAGLDLRLLALRAAGQATAGDPFAGVRVAAIPVVSGEGLITGFSQSVAAALGHLGCDAWVTDCVDMRGIQEATEMGAEVLFLADDTRFIALNVRRARCIDNDLATADGYVAALAAAAGGLTGRPVLLLGLGSIGRAAVHRLFESGADVHVVETDAARLQAALTRWPALRPVSLAEGLERCDLVFDATPACGIITGGDVSSSTIAAVPGVPSGFTVEAQVALGERHIHDPLAIGVAVMAARALI